ncbi:hypothetical protein CFP56_004169 [Quercus suber]|uniref:Secreted protein n=1 Tax=Quercus suber TaxID=58331 RepID=A0AAW0LB32_QUESU
MVRELSFTAGLTALIVLVFVHKTCSTENNIHQCAPSSCGNIQNISNPFRLTSDPEACGDLSSQWSSLSYDRQNYNTRIVVFLSCEKPVNTPFYLDTSTCNDNG